MMRGPMTPTELEAAIRAVGAERYHDKHPYHHLLHGGKLGKGQVQAWALNRFCYQSAVPRKDAALMARAFDRELRREWIHRMLDHDGSGGEEGGIERDRKSTRLNSSHLGISYAVFCLKKKTKIC